MIDGGTFQVGLTVMNFISALTSGEVPDLIFHDAPATILPQNAWNDKLEDVSDVVEPYPNTLTQTVEPTS